MSTKGGPEGPAVTAAAAGGSVERPLTLRVGTGLMVLGAIVNVIGDLFVLPRELQAYVGSVSWAPWAGLVVGVAVHVALWAWIATKLRAGRLWAWGAALALFGLQAINTVLTTIVMVQQQGFDLAAGPQYYIALSVVGLIVVVLISMPDSLAYLRKSRPVDEPVPGGIVEL